MFYDLVNVKNGGNQIVNPEHMQTGNWKIKHRALFNLYSWWDILKCNEIVKTEQFTIKIGKNETELDQKN